jgi:CRISPR-associated endoribonuclease Cas6
MEHNLISKKEWGFLSFKGNRKTRVMEGSLHNFRFARFHFFLRALENINLPAYKGSTLRGGFGHAFKKVVCVNRERICGTCLLKEKCVYSYVFETPPPSGASKMKKYPYVPHPFVITPPLEEKRQYRQGETLCFELTLIGKTIDFLPYFIYTFDELGQIGIGRGRGKYKLEELRNSTNRNGGETIYSAADKILRQNIQSVGLDEIFESFSPPSLPGSLTINFITPTRLKFEGKLTPTLEFHVLIRNMLRRISLLSYFHCGEELDLDYRSLIEESLSIRVKKSNLHWFDWERYSNRQDTRMMMGGFLGSVTFEGEIEPFLPFLLLGEYIHVGKGTSFGLGKYNISETAES